MRVVSMRISVDLFLSVPPSTQPDGLPLTEHWHQMCCSRVGSGTSWAECASGSVNENGCAVCVGVCVCVVYRGSVACDSLGNLSGEVFFFFQSEPRPVVLQLSSAKQCSTAHPPSLWGGGKKQLSIHNNFPLHILLIYSVFSFIPSYLKCFYPHTKLSRTGITELFTNSPMLLEQGRVHIICGWISISAMKYIHLHELLL